MKRALAIVGLGSEVPEATGGPEIKRALNVGLARSESKIALLRGLRVIDVRILKEGEDLKITTASEDERKEGEYRQLDSGQLMRARQFLEDALPAVSRRIAATLWEASIWQETSTLLIAQELPEVGVAITPIPLPMGSMLLILGEN